MPRRSTQRNSEAQRFLAAAEKIRSRAGPLSPDELAGAARLWLTRSAFAALLARALGPEASAKDGWDRACELGYPLFAPAFGLDPGAEPGPLEEGPSPADGTDPAEVFERLFDLRLSLSARGKRLSLASAREGRRQRGTFYTPAWLAERLARRVIAADGGDRPNSRTGLILDPACGSGRLLAAALRQCLVHVPEAKRPSQARETAQRLCGVDRDPAAVALAASFIQFEADPFGAPIPDLSRRFVAGDSLTGSLETASDPEAPAGALDWRRTFPEAFAGESGGFGAIVSNPPFEVLKDLRDPAVRALLDRVRSLRYPLSLRGNLNLSRLFLERSLSLLAPGGRLGFVLPLSFLMDRSAAALREPLIRRGWLEGVEAYPEAARVFENVHQAVLLLWAEKRDRRGRIEVAEEGPAARQAVFTGDELSALDGRTFAIPLCQPADMDLAIRLARQNPAQIKDFFAGRVGEVDQTFYRPMMKSEPASALLLRGAHLAPFSADLSTEDPRERWLDEEAFAKKKGSGPWRSHLAEPRVAQTGIVNREAARRFVATEVPAGIYLGNSLNYFRPLSESPLAAAGLAPDVARGYLLGLLNSTPLEWRFRLTSSNNNINLYEVTALPLPRPVARFPAERIADFVAACLAGFESESERQTPLSSVRRVTSGWGSPSRDDRAVAALIGAVARRRAAETGAERIHWWDHLLDHLVNWHMGLDEPDLDRMLAAIPARSYPGKAGKKGR